MLKPHKLTFILWLASCAGLGFGAATVRQSPLARPIDDMASHAPAREGRHPERMSRGKFVASVAQKGSGDPTSATLGPVEAELAATLDLLSKLEPTSAHPASTNLPSIQAFERRMQEMLADMDEGDEFSDVELVSCEGCVCTALIRLFAATPEHPTPVSPSAVVERAVAFEDPGLGLSTLAMSHPTPSGGRAVAVSVYDATAEDAELLAIGHQTSILAEAQEGLQ